MIHPAKVLKSSVKVSEIILILDWEKGDFIIWIILNQIPSFEKFTVFKISKFHSNILDSSGDNKVVNQSQNDSQIECQSECCLSANQAIVYGVHLVSYQT